MTDRELEVRTEENEADSNAFIDDRTYREPKGKPERTAQTEVERNRETEIFNKFLAGDDAAFRTLYDMYERQLYLYVVRLLTSEVEAQDIFQDIWVRMYKLRGERATVTRFSGLLFTVARNLSLNAIRDRKQLPDTSLEEVRTELESSTWTTTVDDSDLREMLQRALAQLPENQREAFVLREYSGFSYQEIADITGATMINVKTRAWRARERLRKVIGAWLELKATE